MQTDEEQKQIIEKIVHKIFIQEDLLGGARDIEALLSQQREQILEEVKKRIDDVSLDGQHEDVWKYHSLVLEKIESLK